jgi:sRNA-binding protein
VSFYTASWDYEKVLQAGAKRIDLDGTEVGTVTMQEQIEAQKRVQAEKQLLREGRKAQGPVEVVRQLHADGKITTDQLSKISAPPIARRPMPKVKTPESVPTNGVDLTELRALWSNIDNVLSSTEDASLQSAVAARRSRSSSARPPN